MIGGFLIYMIFIVMKLIIKEDRRDRIAKKVLTDEFSNLYEDVNYQTDSNGEQRIINYRNGDGIVMIYGDRNESLYICEDITNPLRVLTYTPQQLKNVIGEWFSEFFELPVENVHHVNKDKLN